MIILNMIVKDEEGVIGSCIFNALRVADACVILDTGSTDKTWEMAYRAGYRFPFIWASSEWIDFSSNRNMAIRMARAQAPSIGNHRILFMDADDTLVRGEKPFEDSDLVDGYMIEHRDGEMSTWKVNLINSRDHSWHWEGVVHEQLVSSRNDLVIQTLDPEIAYIRVGHGGARAKDPDRFLKDAALLERVIEDGTGYNFRNLFLVAKSYQDAGKIDKAIHCYDVALDPAGPVKGCKRFDETVWAAKFFKALCMEVYHGHTVEEIIQAYLQAIDYNRNRLEPYLHLARFCREHNKLEMAYAVIHETDRLRGCKGSIFVDSNILYKIDTERKAIHSMLGMEAL